MPVFGLLKSARVLETVIGMKVMFPVRRDRGQAPATAEHATIEAVLDSGTKVRLRLLGLPPLSMPVELAAGLLEAACPLPAAGGPLLVSNPSSNISYAGEFQTSHAGTGFLQSGADPLEAVGVIGVALGAAFLGGAAIWGVWQVAASAAAFVSRFPVATSLVVGIGAAVHSDQQATAARAPVPSVPACYADGCRVCQNRLTKRQTVLLIPCGCACWHDTCYYRQYGRHQLGKCPLCLDVIIATARV
mmetsp:Transcript_20538/g.59472  ORF Transcript_20538/g.59472 Transcript_20538/m.59472 type:complete len:246 (-) Transcript_20538:214-951(-)